MHLIKVKKCEPIVASRFRKFSQQWCQFTIDPWVLGIVSNGLKLDLIERTVQLSEPCNMSFGESQKILCNNEVWTETSKNGPR